MRSENVRKDSRDPRHKFGKIQIGNKNSAGNFLCDFDEVGSRLAVGNKNAAGNGIGKKLPDSVGTLFGVKPVQIGDFAFIEKLNRRTDESLEKTGKSKSRTTDGRFRNLPRKPSPSGDATQVYRVVIGKLEIQEIKHSEFSFAHENTIHNLRKLRKRNSRIGEFKIAAKNTPPPLSSNILN